MAKKTPVPERGRVGVSAVASGVFKWTQVGSQVIKTGSTAVIMRIYNAGPTNNQNQGELTVKDGNTVVAKIAVNTSCDVEGKNLTVSGYGLSGWYDRV